MPRWLHDQLAAGPSITVVNRIGRDGRLIKQEQVQNETPGIIPILAQLSALDRSVKDAYYCHPSTLHIGKTPKEGGFCGYRNIQMLISYIQGAKAQGFEEFPGRTPGVLRLQDHIERAWDKGINEIGRQQTGGIRDTRKYIGTPEASSSPRPLCPLLILVARLKPCSSAPKSTAPSRCLVTLLRARPKPTNCSSPQWSATSPRPPSATVQTSTRRSCHPSTFSNQATPSQSSASSAAETAPATS